jgi:hypothetical protein
MVKKEEMNIKWVLKHEINYLNTIKWKHIYSNF